MMDENIFPSGYDHVNETASTSDAEELVDNTSEYDYPTRLEDKFKNHLTEEMKELGNDNPKRTIRIYKIND